MLSRYVAYLLVALTFAVSIILPVIFRYETSFAAPTAVYANQILAGNHLAAGGIAESNGYWANAVRTEVYYPLPSLLLSVFVLLTNVPRDYTMFNPIAGLGEIVYFVLARRMLKGVPNASNRLFLSALYYNFVIFHSLRYGSCYIGRAALGQIFFCFFLLAYMFYLNDSASSPRRSASWIIPLILFTLAIGESYYSSTLAVILLTSFMTITLPLIARLIRESPSRSGLPVAALAIFLFVYNTWNVPLMAEALHGSFLENMVRRVLVILGMARPEWYIQNIGLVQVDDVTKLTGIWIGNLIGYASILAVMCVLFMYRPWRRMYLTFEPMSKIWLFSLAIFLSNSSEFAYLLFHAVSPIGLLTKYGLIVLLFIVGYRISLPRGRGGAEVMSSPGRVKLGKSTVLAFLLIVFLVGGVGSLRFAWYYGVGKPCAYQKVEPLSRYLISHSSSQSPIVLAGDAYYTANVFFIVGLHSRVEDVVPNPLGEDALTLYKSLSANDTEDILESMRAKNIRFLLIVQDGGAIWGDEWGYAVTLRNTRLLDQTTSMSKLYDGPAQLFCVTD